MAQATAPARLRSPEAGIVAWLALALGLALATLLVFHELRRFNVVPTPWPLDRRFAGLEAGAGEPGWEIEGDVRGVSAAGGVLTLRNGEPAATVGVRQVWHLEPGDPRAFRLAATVAAKGIDGPGIGEISLVADGDIGRAGLGAIHQLVALRATREAGRYVTRFEFPAAARRVELAVRLRRASGELTVRGLEVVGLAERRLVRFGRVALQAAWAGTLALGCWLFARGIDDRRSAFLLAAAGGAGLLLLLLPQTWRNALVDPLAGVVPGHLLAGEGLADLGHLAIFAVAGVLVRLSRRRDPAWLQLLFLAGVAGLAELLQFLTELRSPTLGDWLTNAVGAVVGWTPAQAWLHRRRVLALARAALGCG